MRPEEYVSNIPGDWRMNLTSQVAEYMQNRFCEEIFEGPCALPNTSIPVPLLCRVDRVIAVIVQAYQHPVRHGKTLDTVASLHYQEINIPMVVLNANGNVRLWYLPGAICHAYQDGAMTASYSTKWLTSKGAWTFPLHGINKVMVPGTHTWVSRMGYDMSEFHSLLSGMLSMIHPHMYEAGREVLIRLNDLANRRDDADMRSILPIWSSVYNSMSIMVNCATPYHIDINGREPWLDMLVMVGEYQPLDFVIPTLELHL
ncbi:hypothetical protein EDD15DRAFT_2204717 [Pisolithus albus]|nr:hypothetical protein EDD15DRAFT_2204717 [Pisolithus albus]